MPEADQARPAEGGPYAGPSPRTAAPPLFTVGIPVFNGRSLLRRCLQSVVGSTFPHERYEVLVADDGSTEPETLAILAELDESLRTEPGFFRVLPLGTNSGGAARPRNRILDEAAGEYVFFVDSDDTIGAEALARVAEALAATPADWVALHQVLVNGRTGATEVSRPRAEVGRLRALTTLTVHKVFRRAEIERQSLRFDEGLPSGQDLSFAFSFLLNARTFLMLGGYDYYFLTRHTEDQQEPPHLSRRARTPDALIEKDHRILRSMLTDLHASGLPEAEQRAVLGEIVLPRMLLLERYLSSVVAAGPDDGPAALRRLSQLLAGPLSVPFGPPELSRGLTPEHLALVADADWYGLRDLLRRPVAAPAAPTGLVERWLDRGRHLADRATGRARHRRVLAELAALRSALDDVRRAQVRLDATLRADRDLPHAPSDESGSRPQV